MKRENVNRYTALEAHKLYQYLEHRAGDSKEIDLWPAQLAKEASIALDQKVTADKASRHAKDLGIKLKVASGNGKESDHNVDVLVRKIACIESKVDALMKAWEGKEASDESAA